ncbi:MAG: MFS transporter [Thermodesulfobacteriota bacterium]|nr:MAG: MFS transporter [Thermodesulfobacteriota bacterium]
MTRKQILTFFAMGLGILAVAMDITAINVAIPAIEKSFKTDVETIQWLVNGYILSFGVLMVTFGRLADIFGRKKIFFMGLFVFGLSSLAGALSTSAWMIIAARVIQGVGGAMLWPSIIGILYSAVSENQKSLAGGLLLAIAGVGNAAGPLVGGALTEFASWRWVLFVNVPVCVIAGIITYLEVGKQEVQEGKSDVDYFGIVSISVSLVALLYALNVSPSWGWTSYKTISLLVIFALFMALFLIVEKRKDDGLIPSDVMGNFQFMIAGFVMFTYIPGFFAILLYVTQYLEKFLNYTPLEAGAVLVPMLVFFSGTSAMSAKIYNEIGARLAIFIGIVLSVLGILGVVLFGLNSSFYGLIPAFILCGVGLGFAVPSITTAGISAVSESRGSLAGGIIYMFQLVGGAFGLAMATTIFTDLAQNDLIKRLSDSSLNISKSELSEITNFVVGSGSSQEILDSLGQQKFDTVFAHVEHAYITGVSGGLIFTAILSSIGAVLAILFIKSKVDNSPVSG